MRASLRLLALLTGLALVFARLALPAAAQSEDQAAHARLLAEFQRAPSVSTGCSLGEVERRLGQLDQAATRLDAMLGQARAAGNPDAATYAACLFNRARVHEDRGELALAYPLLARALATPNATRRGVVEQRLVRVAARLVQTAGCAALGSRYSPHALLRFGDDAALRGCVRDAQRSQPLCTRMAAADIPGPDDISSYLTRRLDPETVAIVDEGFLMVITRRGPRATGFECRLPNSDEQLSQAGWVQVGRQRLLQVSTNTTVSYSCDCDEGEDEASDCRCSDDSSTRYVLGPRGELILALVDAYDEGSMAAWGPDAPELHDATTSGITVEGSVVSVNGRRLRLVRGALVPAP